ncbi:MAG TPA: DUF2141 domain-containing protein [Sneathiellales bacterium]|nr:DUF2141 domain-containing protein [Sneathiellales bacterium]
MGITKIKCRSRRLSVWQMGLAGLFVFSGNAWAGADCPEDTPTRIWVHVDGMKNDKGTITASLYDDNARNFLKKGRRIAKERESASTGAVMVCMPAPGPGMYAVALYHDENANRKFDRNWYGVPKEGHAFSNNAKGRLGPPSHKAAAFTVDGAEAEIHVRMRY